MHGSCSVETREQMTEVALDVQKAGAGLLEEALLNPGLLRILSRDWEMRA